MLRNILLGLGVFAALFSILIFSGKLPIGKTNEKPQGEVTLWGTLPDTSMASVLQQLNAKSETYRVIYKEVSAADFNQRLLEALANGVGPDLILAQHQVILANASRLYPFPVTSFSEKAFKDTYVDGASLFFMRDGAIALPVSIDPLVLFYNRTLFSKHGIINPPRYWDEVASVTPQLTLADNKGGFVESAISLGAPNTPHMKEILMAVVGQLGQVPTLGQYNQEGEYSIRVTANTPHVEGGDILPLATAVRFFSQFADPTKNSYTWNQYGPDADDQFVAEKLAMYIGYVSELPVLRARNQKGEFEMTFLPQTRDYNTFVTGGQMYGIATLKSSKNLVTSLTAQSQLAGGEYGQRIAFSVNALPAFRSYAGTQGLPEVVGRSMLVARPWHDSFFMQSAGLASTMLSDVLSGRVEATAAAAAFVTRLQELYTPF